MATAKVPPCPTTGPVPGYISAAEAVRRYPGVSRTKIYRFCARGDLRSILPPGRPPMYCIEDLDRLVHEREG